MLKRTVKAYLRSKVVSLLLVGTTSGQAMTIKMEDTMPASKANLKRIRAIVKQGKAVVARLEAKQTPRRKAC